MRLDSEVMYKSVLINYIDLDMHKIVQGTSKAVSKCKLE